MTERLKDGGRNFLESFFRRRSLHDENQLSQKRSRIEKIPDFGYASPVKAFMELRHLPGHRDMSIGAKNLLHRPERPDDPSGGLEKDKSFRPGGRFPKKPFQVSPTPGKKTSEKKLVFEKAGC